MKGRRLERVERRRTLVELNLVSEGRSRPALSRRGCALLGSSIMVAAAVLALFVGLH